MSTLSSTPRVADFPWSQSPQEQLRFLLRYATLAPSSHNTQPWKWQIEGDEVALVADRARLMPALDPQGRELIMSCGAALHHLQLAIRAFGFAALTQTLPDPARPDLLARVRLGAPRPPSKDDELLFGFVPKRHTHRGHFSPRPLPSELLHALEAQAQTEGATLHFAQNDEQKKAIIELIARGDVIQNRDPAIRSDVADWMAPRSDRKDGVPVEALGAHGLLAPLTPLTQRLWDRGGAIADKDRALAQSAPVLVVLCTSDEGPLAWLGAGQALSRVLLRARAAQVWASFFSQPVQVDEVWFQLRRLLGIHFFPQLVFRLGYAAQPAPATPRRAVDDVVSLAGTDEDEPIPPFSG